MIMSFLFQYLNSKNIDIVKPMFLYPIPKQKYIMSQLLPFILWGILFAILISIIHTIVKFFLIPEPASKTYTTKFQILLKTLSFWLFFIYFINGFIIVTGINFLYLIITESQSVPINLSIQEADIPFFFLGGLLMILYPIYEIFKEEFSKFERLSVSSQEARKEKFKEFCLQYTNYKESTGNPTLQVKNFRDDGTILVEASEISGYFTKKLRFSLQYHQIIDIEGTPTEIESLEIADCFFLKTGGNYSFFTVLNWTKEPNFQEQIQKLKTNQDLLILKPFIRLHQNEIAEKFCYTEMKAFITAHEKFKTIEKED